MCWLKIQWKYLVPPAFFRWKASLHIVQLQLLNISISWTILDYFGPYWNTSPTEWKDENCNGIGDVWNRWWVGWWERWWQRCSDWLSAWRDCWTTVLQGNGIELFALLECWYTCELCDTTDAWFYSFCLNKLINLQQVISICLIMPLPLNVAVGIIKQILISALSCFRMLCSYY